MNIGTGEEAFTLHASPVGVVKCTALKRDAWEARLLEEITRLTGPAPNKYGHVFVYRADHDLCSVCGKTHLDECDHDLSYEIYQAGKCRKCGYCD